MNWNLSDLKSVEKNNHTVFSCFACGGGSSMGYKLAGYNVVGYNEIDNTMSELYDSNLKCQHSFVCDIRDLINSELPDELYNLDILDGSPPCTTFSMAGLREKTWGIEKQFREGQTKQVLDDLSFHFLNLARLIRPKIIVMENVSGLMIGNAQKYVAKIYELLDKIDYQAQHFILHADTMGVPQRRTRFILLAMRTDLCNCFADKLNLFSTLPQIDMTFDERRIVLNDILIDKKSKRTTQNYSDDRFGDIICNVNESMPTITTINRYWLNMKELVGDKTLMRAQTFPDDYNFLSNKIQYVLGMSVPPFMMKQIATRIKTMWLNKLEQ